jgi:hypothetical protein
MNLTLRFKDFWVGFQENENFFLDILVDRGYKVAIERDGRAKVDLEIVSVFPPYQDITHRLASKVHTRLPRIFKKVVDNRSNRLESLRNSLCGRRVFYTGENIRVPLDKSISGSLSFDQDNFGTFNAYCPLWYLDLDFYNSRYSARLGVKIKKDDLLKPRVLDLKLKKNFMCAFINNPESTRIRAIREFSKYFNVDVYGSYTGNRVASKNEVATNYRFMLCFENDLYPGYVTEKPIEAYLAGTVPVYWGDFGNDQSINRKAILNLADFNNLEEFVLYVSNLSIDEYREIYEQPFLLRVPDISKVSDILFPKD